MPGDLDPRALSKLLAPTLNHGVLSRKKRAGVDAENGMLFEKAPLPSNTPVVFVGHDAKGVVTSVALSRV